MSHLNSTMSTATILLADDEDTLRKNLAQVLPEEGFDVIACRDGTEALRALKTSAVDAIITDLRMPGISGMELIDHATELAPDAAIIVITAFGEVETAVEAIKKGAADYICKPLIFDEVIFRLKRLLAHDDLVRENKLLREQVRQSYDYSEIVGKSPAMTAILETIRRISHTTSNVLICGESGTGKELLARALHYGGVTKDKPFIAVNCGALVETLVESELFGYCRGAFTGAETDRAGYFEAADGGTLFLDEIGNLPLKGQAVLLRAIEEKTITRVGDNRPRPVNIRIVAATNRDLEKAIEAGEFREDLYYRLNVVRITVPPLRERREDIPALIEYFVRKYNAELKCNCPGFEPKAMEAMCRHEWRGNVRELKNVVERALIFAGDRPVRLEDLSLPKSASAASPPVSLDLRTATREFEKQHILKVLSNFGNNKVATAEALGIGLSSLYRKMDELGISKMLREPSASRMNLPATDGRSGPPNGDLREMKRVCVGCCLAVLVSFGAAIAMPPGHGRHPPMPGERFYFQCRVEGEPEPAVVEVALALESAAVEAELDQVVSLPAPFRPIRLRRYLPKAALEQGVVPDKTGKGKPAVLLSIEGPTQSLRRWLVADEPARNRLISLIGTWRYMSVADKQQRDELFEQFKKEPTRPPRLIVSRADRSDSRALPVEAGAVHVLKDLGCKVRILGFYSHYGMDKKTKKPVNRSKKRINPAVHMEIERDGKTERRWVFARFPDFKMHDAEQLPYRTLLDCPIDRRRPTPDFVLVTIGRARHEVWSRRDGKSLSEPIALKDRLKVTGSQYTFHLARFVPSGRLVERYRPTEAKLGVPALQIEVPDAGNQSMLWLELGKQRVISTPKGRLVVAFGPRSVDVPGGRQRPPQRTMGSGSLERPSRR